MNSPPRRHTAFLTAVNGLPPTVGEHRGPSAARDLPSAAPALPKEANGGREEHVLRRILSKDNVLLIALIVFMAAGVGIGVGLQSYKLTPRQLMYVDFPGYLFMRMLKLLILPLVTSSIIVGLASLDMRSSGRIGGFAVAYYLVTTLLAVILGIVLAVSIRPGERGSSKSDIANETEVPRISVTEDKILDLIRQVPERVILFATASCPAATSPFPY